MHSILCKMTEKARGIRLTVCALRLLVMAFQFHGDWKKWIRLSPDLNGPFLDVGRVWTKKIGKIGQNRPKNVFFCPKGPQWKYLSPLRLGQKFNQSRFPRAIQNARVCLRSTNGSEMRLRALGTKLTLFRQENRLFNLAAVTSLIATNLKA